MKTKTMLGAVAIAMLALLASACGSAESYSPAAVAFVVGDTMGNEAPVAYVPFLPEEIMDRAASEFSVYAVVSVSKNPELFRSSIPEYSGVTTAQRRQDHAYFLNQLKADIREKSKPSDEGSDLLKAISIAAAYLDSTAGDRERFLVIIDNFLPVDGEFKFDDNNILAYFSGERALIDIRTDFTISYLIENSVIADLTGTTVVAAGCGNTAPPQEPLSSNQRSLLWAFWEKAFDSANAKEIVRIQGQTGQKSSSPLPVTELSFPKEEGIVLPGDPGKGNAVEGSDVEHGDGPGEESDDGATDDAIPGTEFIGEEKVAFLPGTCIYMDESEAIDVLKPIAERLMADRNAGVSMLLAGCTAGDSNNARSIELSLSRAKAVKATLESLHVPPSRLWAVGLGSDNRWHVAGFELSDPMSQMNRQVVLLRTDSEAATEIMARYEPQ